ncbi:transcriptional regulator [uncultured Thiodictyon sp.]|uniref:helix-turn-helix domain-containing protein n=1 Tax=uncultured Thiodictyon sp. TaxID=1846217 RepID=UPI0025D5D0D2|nr:transcriptional regulator [uncultured Thiodictyon sp.]
MWPHGSNGTRCPHRPTAGVTLLRHLMDVHGLRQSDLPEIGAQSVVSDILIGRRSLNIRQVKALAARFGIPVGNFL